MTLQEHLAAGYDFYVRGRRGLWEPELLGSEINADDALRKEACAKLQDLEAIERAQRRCHVSKTQLQILRAGFAKT